MLLEKMATPPPSYGKVHAENCPLNHFWISYQASSKTNVFKQPLKRLNTKKLIPAYVFTTFKQLLPALPPALAELTFEAQL
jgi:hypothetical protein